MSPSPICKKKKNMAWARPEWTQQDPTCLQTSPLMLKPSVPSQLHHRNSTEWTLCSLLLRNCCMLNRNTVKLVQIHHADLSLSLSLSLQDCGEEERWVFGSETAAFTSQEVSVSGIKTHTWMITDQQQWCTCFMTRIAVRSIVHYALNFSEWIVILNLYSKLHYWLCTEYYLTLCISNTNIITHLEILSVVCLHCAV